MQELPPLTRVARTVLECCVYNLWDIRRDNQPLDTYMIHCYFDGKSPESKHISLVEIEDCILYFNEVGLARDITYDFRGDITFFLTHKGFYYFELEKSILSEQRKEVLLNSILFPVIVSIITTTITLLITGLLI